MPSLPIAFVTDTSHFQWFDPLAAFLLYAAIYIPLSWIWPHPVLKWWWWICMHTFWRMRVVGLENIPKTGGAILACNHVSKIDWMFVFAACPRRVRAAKGPGRQIPQACRVATGPVRVPWLPATPYTRV